MVLTLFRAIGMVALFLLLTPVRAQEARATDQRLQTMLTKAASEAAALTDKLPSFVCKETAVSERLHKGKVKKRLDLVADLSVRRGADGKLAESFAPTQRNGKPFTSEHLNIPVYVSGGFQHAMSYFSTSRRPCYRYSLAGNRIDFVSDPAAAGNAECSHEIGITGFALFDTNDEMVHIERRVAAEIAKHGSAADFGAVELAPVELNGHIYRLSAHLHAEMGAGEDFDRFEASYTQCRLFTASITLRPGSSVITDETPAPAPK